MVSAKFILFVVGVVVILASLIGLAFSFGFIPDFLEALPPDPRIYFGATLLFGLIALGYSFSRTLTY